MSERLTKREVAEICRCCSGTVMAAVRRGEIPEPTRVGGKLLWNRERLERWLDGQRDDDAPSGDPWMERLKNGGI